jgi:hypothetical protein
MLIIQTKSVISKVPYFAATEGATDNVKDITYAAIGAAVNTGKDVIAGQGTQM